MFNRWRISKELDLFKSPAFLFLHRRNKETNEKLYDWRLGSGIGGITTIVMILLSFCLVLAMGIEMYSGQYDIIRQI
jgi:hypothetical protein